MTNPPQNLIICPIVYAMVIPMMMMNMCVSFYQFTCFPIYRIRKVKRSDYIVFDCYQLGYLNFIEKSHCIYCEHGNGLMA